jgi:hypothetical protein
MARTGRPRNVVKNNKLYLTFDAISTFKQTIKLSKEEYDFVVSNVDKLGLEQFIKGDNGELVRNKVYSILDNNIDITCPEETTIENFEINLNGEP